MTYAKLVDVGIAEPRVKARVVTLEELLTAFVTLASVKASTQAGHRPWPRLFQNLRASCATNWVEKYPNHVVAKWLGHSPMIAATHYLQAREHHFEDVVSGGTTKDQQNGQKQGPAPAEDCVHMCVQSKAAANSSDSHEVQKNSRKPAITRNVARCCNAGEIVLMGSTGLEPVTSTV